MKKYYFKFFLLLIGIFSTVNLYAFALSAKQKGLIETIDGFSIPVQRICMGVSYPPQFNFRISPYEEGYCTFGKVSANDYDKRNNYADYNKFINQRCGELIFKKNGKVDVKYMSGNFIPDVEPQHLKNSYFEDYENGVKVYFNKIRRVIFYDEYSF